MTTPSPTGSTTRRTRAPAVATAPVTNPATGEVTGEVALGQRRGRPRRDRRGRRRIPRLAGHLAGQAHRDPVQLPRAAQRAQAGAGRDHHQRARQGRLRRARRGQPRPGGRRIRLRHPASAQGRIHRERLDQGRRVLDPPAARAGRHHQPVQLPRHGADVVLPHRDRGRQHRRAQAVREGPVGLAVGGRAVGRSRSAARGVQRAAGRQDRRRRTADQQGHQVGVASSAPPRSPSTSTPPAPRTGSGCRRSAARRTTR